MIARVSPGAPRDVRFVNAAALSYTIREIDVPGTAAATPGTAPTVN